MIDNFIEPCGSPTVLVRRSDQFSNFLSIRARLHTLTHPLPVESTIRSMRFQAIRTRSNSTITNALPPKCPVHVQEAHRRAPLTVQRLFRARGHRIIQYSVAILQARRAWDYCPSVPGALRSACMVLLYFQALPIICGS